MDEMLREFEEELSSCHSLMKDFKKQMKSFQSTISTAPSETQTYDHVIKKGSTYTFPRAQRFKDPEPQVEEIAAPIQEFISPSAYDQVKRKQPTAFISNTLRFPKEDLIQMEEINPNYDAVKKKQPQVSILPEHNKNKERTVDQSGTYEGFDDLETEASMSRFLGPGKYDIKYNETQKSVAFSKGNRFPQPRQDELTDINPNYDAVKKRAQTTVIAKKQQKTKQLILKEQIEEMNEKLKAEEYRRRPLDIDRGIRANQPQTIIRKSHNEIMNHPPGSKMRRFLILKLLDDLKYNSGLGPGAYELQEPEKEPCMVVFKSHSTERRVPRGDKPVPGPDYYYSKDDYIRPDPIQIAFGKEERIKKIRKEDLDMKQPIDPNYDFVKPAVPGGVINPEWQNKGLIPSDDALVKQRVGPGYYDQKFDVVEPRTDLGAVKYQDVTEKNDRIKQMDPINNIEFHDYEEILYPDLEAIKPHKPEFKYHEDTEHQPEHIPDKILFPEKHQFYDANLDAVKEKVGKTEILLAGKKGRMMEEFLLYEKDINMFKEYMNRLKKMPELGQYKVNYKQIDKDHKVVDFDRYPERDNDPIEKAEGAVNGDNLMLNPDLPKKHMPNVDFDKQIDRPDPFQGKQDHEGELIINANYDPIKPRIKKIMEFEKQLDRPPSPKAKDTELIVEPQFQHVEKRVKGNLNFEKHGGRDDDPRFKEKQDDRALIVEPKEVKPKVKTGVKMSGGGSRFPPKQDKEKNPIPAPVNVSKIEKAEKAMRPNIPGVNMKNQSGRKSLSVQKKK